MGVGFSSILFHYDVVMNFILMGSYTYRYAHDERFGAFKRSTKCVVLGEYSSYLDIYKTRVEVVHTVIHKNTSYIC